MLGENNNINFDLTLTMQDFTVSVKKVETLLRQMRQELKQTADATTAAEKRYGSLGRSLHDFMIVAASARFAVLDFHDVFLRLPMSVIKTSGEIERLTKLMEGLSTAADKVADANKGKAFIFNMAMNAPFDVKTLTDSFVKLKSAGIDPTNGSMKALVDSVAKFGGSSDQLHRASIAIQQMAGKGVVSMEELRQQLGEAVPNAINMMATGVGKSMGDLVKSISKGEVEAKSALERMFAVMRVENYGAASGMMDTWVGMIEQLKTKWELFKLSVGGGNGVFTEARKELQNLLDMMDGETARKLGADMAEGFYELSKAITGSAKAIIDHYEDIKTFLGGILVIYGVQKLASIFTAVKTHIAAVSAAYKTSALEYQELESKKAIQLALSQEKEAAAVAARVGLMEVELVEKGTILAQMQMQHQRHMEAIRLNEIATAQMQKTLCMEGASVAILASKQKIAALRAEAEAVLLAGNALHSERQVLVENLAATRALANEKMNLARATASAGSAATVAGTQMSGMKGVFTALGGWMTVITAAIMGAVWAWEEYGNAAEKAAERARRAANGMSTQADLTNVRTKRTALEEELKLNEAKADDDVSKLNGWKLEEKKKRLDDLKKEELNHKENLLKQTVDDTLRLQTREDDRELKGQTDLINKKLDETKRKNAEEIADIVENTKLSQEQKEKQIAEVQKKYGTDIKSTGKDLFMKEISFYTAKMKAAEKELKTATGDRVAEIEGIIKGYKERISSATSNLTKNELIGTPNLKVSGTGDKGGGAGAQSPINNLIQRLKGDVAELKQTATSFTANADETVSAYERALAKYSAMWESGKFKFGKNKDKNADKKQIELVASLEAEKEVFQEAVKFIEDYNKKIRENSLQIADAYELIVNPFGAKKSSGEKSLDIFFKKIETDTLALKAFEETAKKAGLSFQEMKTKLYQDQATKDMAAFLQPLDRGSERSNIEKSNLDSTSKKTALFDFDQKIAKTQFDQLRKGMKEGSDEIKAADAAFEKFTKNSKENFERDIRTPLQSLRETWENTTDQMKQASARWAENFMDHLTELVTTGKTDWKAMLRSMLVDTTRMNLQKSLGGIITKSFEGLGGLLTKGVSSIADKTGIGNMFSGLWDSIKTTGSKILGLGDSTSDATAKTAEGIVQKGLEIAGISTKTAAEVTAATAMTALATSAQYAAMALSQISGVGGIGTMAGGSMGMLGGIGGLGSLASQFSTASTYGTMIGSQQTAMLAAQDAAFADTSIWSTIASWFADGGVMTEFGSIPLRKYANGGIANRPQAAIFGEGSMPEAYVPLPDGRSIPVTMSGGASGGDNVVISISVVNNTDGSQSESSTASGKDPAFYKGIAEKIKVIVKQEMLDQQRPGGVLYRKS